MSVHEISELMTDKDVERLTGVPRGTLKYFRHRGHGGPPSFKLTPRQIRYRREDVEKWIREQYEASQGQRTA